LLARGVRIHFDYADGNACGAVDAGTVICYALLTMTFMDFFIDWQ